MSAAMTVQTHSIGVCENKNVLETFPPSVPTEGVPRLPINPLLIGGRGVAELTPPIARLTAIWRIGRTPLVRSELQWVPVVIGGGRRSGRHFAKYPLHGSEAPGTQ